MTPTHVWGTQSYRMSSSICQAAIHDGKVVPGNGGSVQFSFVKMVDQKFKGSINHGITSNDADKEDRAMVFGSGHLGCEDGWFQAKFKIILKFLKLLFSEKGFVDKSFFVRKF